MTGDDGTWGEIFRRFRREFGLWQLPELPIFAMADKSVCPISGRLFMRRGAPCGRAGLAWDSVACGGRMLCGGGMARCGQMEPCGARKSRRAKSSMARSLRYGELETVSWNQDGLDGGVRRLKGY